MLKRVKLRTICLYMWTCVFICEFILKKGSFQSDFSSEILPRNWLRIKQHNRGFNRWYLALWLQQEHEHQNVITDWWTFLWGVKEYPGLAPKYAYSVFAYLWTSCHGSSCLDNGAHCRCTDSQDLLARSPGWSVWADPPPCQMQQWSDPVLPPWA